MASAASGYGNRGEEKQKAPEICVEGAATAKAAATTIEDEEEAKDAGSGGAGVGALVANRSRNEALAEPVTDAIDAVDKCPRPVAAPAATEYRLRFINFNMANSSTFDSFDSVIRDSLDAEFCDGHPVDLTFCTLLETRLPLSSWLQDRESKRGLPLDATRVRDALKDGSSADQPLQGFLEGMASKYNGNLKTVLTYSRRCFAEKGYPIHGRFPAESKVAGVAVPNPKKAFVGEAIVDNLHGVRLLFLGAHFPMGKLAAALEDTTADPLLMSKIIFARTLRRVLRQVGRHGLDTQSCVVLQGDLNSRTLLNDRGLDDVLLAFLRDDQAQAATSHGLSLPPGRWREVIECDRAGSLPVTYKFAEDVGPSFERGPPDQSFSLDDVLQAARPTMPRSGHADEYGRIMGKIPPAQLASWGIHFKDTSFRPFRFPACADRVLCWVPDALHKRMSWSLPRGGYKVDHRQGGSDHRPVYLEAILCIDPESVASASMPVADVEANHAGCKIHAAVCDEDSDSAGEESTIKSSWWPGRIWT